MWSFWSVNCPLLISQISNSQICIDLAIQNGVRIIRSTYPKSFYRDLCIQGRRQNWPQVEQILKEKFIIPNSCLFYVEDEDRFHQYEEVAKASKGQIQVLPLDEVKKRFPSAPSIQTKLPIFHDKKAGVIYAKKYIQCMINYLKKYSNVTIYEQTSVVSIQNDQRCVRLICTNENGIVNIQAKKISLSCGRWIGNLVPIMNKIAKQSRQAVSFWQMKNPQNYKIGKFPCWAHQKNGNEYYGLPDYDNIGLKYGIDSKGQMDFNKFTAQTQYQQFMTKEYKRTTEQYFKDQYLKMNKIEKCYYTMTKSEDFVIDWSDQFENIFIVSPCSGHGFKFGPIIGRIISDLLIKDQSLAVFEQNRYICRIYYHLGINFIE